MLSIKNVYTKSRHVMNFVPFIDVVFMLLMYFFVAAEIRPEEGDFVTNVGGRGPHIGPPLVTRDAIEVWIADSPSGPTVKLGGENGRQLLNFKELAGQLKGAVGADSVVVFDGPPNVSIQTVAMAMDAASEAKAPAMAFADRDIRNAKKGMAP